MATHARMGDVVPPGLLPPPPPGQRPQLSPRSQLGLHMLPIFLWSEAFHCMLRTKVKNRKIPGHQTNNS